MSAGGPSVSSRSTRLGVRAALVDGELVRGDVVVADGRVLEVGATAAAGGGSGVAVPGFLDLHINGLVGVDFLSTDLDGYRAAGVALAGARGGGAPPAV